MRFLRMLAFGILLLSAALCLGYCGHGSKVHYDPSSREFVEARLSLCQNIPDTAYACGDICYSCYRSWDSTGLIDTHWSEIGVRLAYVLPVCILERGTLGDPWGVPSYAVDALLETDTGIVAVKAEVRSDDMQSRIESALVDGRRVDSLIDSLAQTPGITDGHLPYGLRYSAHACCSILSVVVDGRQSIVVLMPVKSHLPLVLYIDSVVTTWAGVSR